MASASRGEFHRGELIGKYEVLTQLTMGGMAELFLGFTSGPGGFRKYVVIKRILPDVKGNEELVKMFLDEARITAAFNQDRKSTRLNSSHIQKSRMPSSA